MLPELPLNHWPPAPQILLFQALFCARLPAQDRATPPGFSPFQAPIMGCLEQGLCSVSHILSERRFLFVGVPRVPLGIVQKAYRSSSMIRFFTPSAARGNSGQWTTK